MCSNFNVELEMGFLLSAMGPASLNSGESYFGGDKHFKKSLIDGVPVCRFWDYSSLLVNLLTQLMFIFYAIFHESDKVGSVNAHNASRLQCFNNSLPDSRLFLTGSVSWAQKLGRHSAPWVSTCTTSSLWQLMSLRIADRSKSNDCRLRDHRGRNSAHWRGISEIVVSVKKSHGTELGESRSDPVPVVARLTPVILQNAAFVERWLTPC